ncbi:hypothetical protein E3P92_01238 [Wallemia ichthyophaga]|uniref:Uncharacterized protein n=1 Tax=Wallemia ichthyophaga TaxID=245174 RepID=A0A4T0EJV4_WALIC|nr:hypothetical protein E3P91_00945 [Wallemia ichthyophaga]TIA92823.1 hypothetical protein E3P97_01252 [Wallemia ichthyophaga]TIB15066.1 hypothetical protein E3P90_00997 [Wallemia ichthyophaga]TIB16760.1 hypothetical protein E3P92_01238 [Wallemia ichthyophaga]TIB16887.1 hypothetical protein E3P93_00854 [Wallemia ichthyophaga]
MHSPLSHTHAHDVNRLLRMERDLYKQFNAAVGWVGMWIEHTTRTLTLTLTQLLRIPTTDRIFLSYQYHLVHLLKLIAAYEKAGLLSAHFFILIRHSFFFVHSACHSHPHSPEHHKAHLNQFRLLLEKCNQNGVNN